MRKSKAFTIVELMITIAIIGILLTLAIPSLTQSMSYSKKSQANTARRIIVNAVDYWVKDNINPVQRPSDFSSVNSQGNTVTDYITNTEIFSSSNKKIKNVTIQGEEHKVVVDDEDENADMELEFKDAVLYIGYGYDEKNAFYHCMLGEEHFDENTKKIKNLENLKKQNRIVEGYEYKEYL